MKATVVQPMRVRLADGTEARACCGPGVLNIPGVVAYQADGEPRRGVCCHTGAARAGGLAQLHQEALDTNQVYRALGAMLGGARRSPSDRHELWAVVCEPGRVLYSTRPTRDEAERVLREQRHLAEKFGRPRVVRVVARLR